MNPSLLIQFLIVAVLGIVIGIPIGGALDKTQSPPVELIPSTVWLDPDGSGRPEPPVGAVSRLTSEWVSVEYAPGAAVIKTGKDKIHVDAAVQIRGLKPRRIVCVRTDGALGTCAEWVVDEDGECPCR